MLVAQKNLLLESLSVNEVKLCFEGPFYLSLMLTFPPPPLVKIHNLYNVGNETGDLLIADL